MTLARSTPEEQGVGSAVLHDLVDAFDRSEHELHSVMVVRHGRVIAEGAWSPYEVGERHLLFSLSKSVLSIAVGLAVADGRLSLDERVVDLLADELPAQVSEHLAAMAVWHLLTMTTGHLEDTIDKVRGHGTTWVRDLLALPVEAEPGTAFVYNSGASYLLSAIVQRATGETVHDYLRPRLYEPLGITDATWEVSPDGVTMGGFGLSLPTEAIARFGRLLLHGGRWDGVQVLPADWLAAATAAQVSTEAKEESDWKFGYGFQFWRGGHDSYRADGAFGQFCLVLPEQDTVVVTTAAADDLQAVIDVVWATLLPGLKNPEALPADPAGVQRLADRLSRLRIDPPVGSGPTRADLTGRTYAVDLDPEAAATDGTGLTAIRFGADAVTVDFTVDDLTAPIVCGHERWRESTVDLPPFTTRAVASGTWVDGRYVATLRFPQTPYEYTFTCTFTGATVEIDASVNVSIGVIRPSFHQTGRMV